MSTLTLGTASAAPVTDIYDEQLVQPNAVDYVAAGSTVALEAFKAHILNAYQQDHGGVIDGSVLSSAYQFGVNESKTLRFGTTDGTNWGIGSPTITVLPISGTGAFGGITQGSFDYTAFAFNEITDGEQDEHVVSFGVTVLSSLNRDYGNVTVTGRFASGSTVSATRAITEQPTFGDTFYGFAAPAGDYFSGFTMEYDGAIVPDVRLWFDDIGFITAVVPEPSSAAIILLGGIVSLRRRVPSS